MERRSSDFIYLISEHWASENQTKRQPVKIGQKEKTDKVSESDCATLAYGQHWVHNKYEYCNIASWNSPIKILHSKKSKVLYTETLHMSPNQRAMIYSATLEQIGNGCQHLVFSRIEPILPALYTKILQIKQENRITALYQTNLAENWQKWVCLWTCGGSHGVVWSIIC